MRTLSIRQPWAWLIVHGHKTIENRDWDTPWRGEFLIHAGVGLVQRDYRQIQRLAKLELDIVIPDFTDLEQVPRGGIVGVAELVRVVTDSESPFFMGPFGFELRNARPLPFVPWKGQLGWFDVPRTAVGLPALEVA